MSEAMVIILTLVSVCFSAWAGWSAFQACDIANNPVPRPYGWVRRRLTGRKGSARFYRWFPGERS